MAKVGRNDPCPCGSGKKYKRCCLPREREAGSEGWSPPFPDDVGALPPLDALVGDEELDELPFLYPASPPADGPVHLQAPLPPWLPADLSGMSTSKIIERLRGLGVGFERERFMEDVGTFRSAEELSEHWREVHSPTVRCADEGFLWSAAMVLWERLAPDTASDERLDAMMREGYRLVCGGRAAEGCTLWLEVWDHLKGRFAPDMRSIEEAESVFSGSQFLFNWCQDLDTELWNAGTEDGTFFERRIAFCREFCGRFPDTGGTVIADMRSSEAETLCALGRVEEGEAAFGALTEEFPHNAWGYIRWGDVYWLEFFRDRVPLDRDRAERIYRMALERGVDDEESVHQRLAVLGLDRGPTGGEPDLPALCTFCEREADPRCTYRGLDVCSRCHTRLKIGKLERRAPPADRFLPAVVGSGGEACVDALNLYATLFPRALAADLFGVALANLDDEEMGDYFLASMAIAARSVWLFGQGARREKHMRPDRIHALHVLGHLIIDGIIRGAVEGRPGPEIELEGVTALLEMGTAVDNAIISILQDLARHDNGTLRPHITESIRHILGR